MGYTALAWDHPEQAYHLLRRVALLRPYDPQSYLAMAACLAELGNTDLAILYYEVALAGEWDRRFCEFRRIAMVDYLRARSEQLTAAADRLEAALHEED